MISYAQNFEDVMLARVFAGRKDGFYVDVGAADPVNLSVTKWFYDIGWSGLNVEPNQALFERLVADRPRDINLNCGVGASEGQAPFFEPRIGELSSFDPRIHSIAERDGTTGSTRTVAVMPLTRLLDQHCPQRSIDFLKIDVEGWEFEVLKGLDLGKYRPTVIVVEATLPQQRVESHAEWEPLVLGAGYSFVYFDGVNRFYLANESADHKKLFSTPPNVFDDFETFPLVRARTDAEQRLEAVHKLEHIIHGLERITNEKEDVIRRQQLAITQMKGSQLPHTDVSGPEDVEDGILDSDGLRTIAVDLTPVLPGGENGGAKVFVLELLRRLAELAPKTQFVLLTQGASHGELAALDGANVRRLMVVNLNKPASRTLAARAFSRALAYLPGRLGRVAGRAGYSLLTLAKRGASRPLLRDLDADLLFCPFTAPTYFEPAVPTVSVIYDLQYNAYPEFFAPHEFAQRARTFDEARRKSTMLVAISDFTRDSAISAAKLDPNQIRTIHLHASQHSLRTAPRDETILARLNLVRQRYLIYPANFWRHKNHEILLTGFGLARQRGLPDGVCLVCTGVPGERRDWLMRAARRLGLEGRVLFPGYLANPELLALMSNSAGMIFPSLYEGFGLPVVEAMATGVPVACSNVTSLPEVAGNAAILFDPRVPEDVATAMISLTQDMELRSRLIAAGNARAAEFSDSGKMARQYWKIFEQAARSELQSNVLSGVHSDGWLGPHASIQIAPATQASNLLLEVSLPDWAPTSKVTMSVLRNSKRINKTSIGRGEHATTAIALGPSGGSVTVELSPAFVPSLTGFGNDERELAAMLAKCEIAHPDGTRTTLFP